MEQRLFNIFKTTNVTKLILVSKTSCITKVTTISNYYNTRNAPTFSSRNIKTVRYGLKSISYMAQKIWNLVPKEMKQITTLNEFKAKIKIWKLENCPCRLCKPSTDRVHYIMPFYMTNVVRLRVRGSLSGNINTAEI